MVKFFFLSNSVSFFVVLFYISSV